MKFVSKVALAAAFTAGLATVVTAPPAAAQKKDKKPAAAPLKLSDAVRKPVAAAQTALAANDTATALAQLATAEPLATTDDERYIVAALKLQANAKSNDRSALMPLLEALITNPKTPAEDVARYSYFRGTLAFEQKKYADALPYLTKARDLGYQDANMSLQIAQAQIESGNVAGGIAELQKAIDAETAAGRKAPESWYSYAVAKAYGTGNAAETSAWLKRSLAAYPTPQNWRKTLLVYRESAEKSATKLDRKQQLDLFRLMRATKSLADQGDYLEYADIAYFGGLPGEAKTVIDEGRATGKIPAGNTNAARIYTDANTALKSEGSLATVEAKARTAADGKTAAQTADAYLAVDNTAKAIELYRLALQKGGVDTSEVNLHLGVALAQAGQKAETKTAFQAVTTGPRKDMAGFWIQYLDTGSTAAAPAAPAAPAT